MGIQSKTFSQNNQSQQTLTVSLPKDRKARSQKKKKKSGTGKYNVARKLMASPGTVITLYGMIKIKIRNTSSLGREAH